MSLIAISPASYYHCDVILIMTSFATELVTPTIIDIRTYITDTLPLLIYRDSEESMTRPCSEVQCFHYCTVHVDEGQCQPQKQAVLVCECHTEIRSIVDFLPYVGT